MLDAFEPPIFCAIFHWASFCFCKREIELFLHSFSAVFPTSTNFQFEKNAKNCRLQTMYVFLSKSEGITNYIKKMKRKHFYLKSVSLSVVFHERILVQSAFFSLNDINFSRSFYTSLSRVLHEELEFCKSSKKIHVYLLSLS